MSRPTVSRRSSAPGVSFFAFQDIITAVVGIFILITLIMILELLEKVDAESKTREGDAAAIARVIMQAKTSADAIEAELSQISQSMDAQTNVLAESSTVTAESLSQQLTEQLEQSVELQRQVNTVQRQVDDAKRRLAADRRESESRQELADKEAGATLAEAEKLAERAGKLKDSTFPLYNGTLDDGRALVVIRLGDHPHENGTGAVVDRVSMRDGVARRRWVYNTVEDLQADLAGRNHRRCHYAIHVAPGGAEDFETLKRFMDSRRTPIRYGFDVTGSEDDVQLMFEIEDE